MRKTLFLIYATFVLAPMAAAGKSPHAAKPKSGSAAGPAAHSPLDQAKVEKLYSEGDFEPAIALLEDFQKSNARFTRGESLMVYKYLGVMYCADQSTREKGKSYFYKLLKVDPEAKILDMYVSIVVQDIFKNTLDELMGQKGFRASDREDRSNGMDPESQAHSMPKRPQPAQGTKPATAALESRKSHAAYWWIGGAALVVGLGGYYVLAHGSGKEPDKNIGVDL